MKNSSTANLQLRSDDDTSNMYVSYRVLRLIHICSDHYSSVKLLFKNFPWTSYHISTLQCD